MLSFVAATSMTAMLAGSPEPGAQRPLDLPTVTISVHSAPSVSPVIIDRTLEEAGAIWRPTGVSFRWQKVDPERSDSTPPQPTRPRVLIDDRRGTPRGASAPMGWVTFVDDEPDGDIHISHANAEQYVLAFGGVGGANRRMTPAERFLLIGRTLGRALAHEIGHYLLKSKQHTTNGLMKGRRTVKEFIDVQRRGFEIDTLQRDAIVRRIRELADVTGLG
jgi:hypothetical protein